MDPAPVRHEVLSAWLLPFVPFLTFVAIVTIADALLKLRIMWLERRINQLEVKSRKLVQERLLAQQAAFDDSYWFDPEGHSHFCDSPTNSPDGTIQERTDH